MPDEGLPARKSFRPVIGGDLNSVVGQCQFSILPALSFSFAKQSQFVFQTVPVQAWYFPAHDSLLVSPNLGLRRKGLEKKEQILLIRSVGMACPSNCAVAHQTVLLRNGMQLWKELLAVPLAA